MKLANGVSDWEHAKLSDVDVFSDSGTWRCVRKRYTKRLRCNNSCHLYLKLEQSNTPDKTTLSELDEGGRISLLKQKAYPVVDAENWKASDES